MWHRKEERRESHLCSGSQILDLSLTKRAHGVGISLQIYTFFHFLLMLESPSFHSLPYPTDCFFFFSILSHFSFFLPSGLKLMTQFPQGNKRIDIHFHTRLYFVIFDLFFGVGDGTSQYMNTFSVSAWNSLL